MHKQKNVKVFINGEWKEMDIDIVPFDTIITKGNSLRHPLYELSAFTEEHPKEGSFEYTIDVEGIKKMGK